MKVTDINDHKRKIGKIAYVYKLEDLDQYVVVGKRVADEPWGEGSYVRYQCGTKFVVDSKVEDMQAVVLRGKMVKPS